MNDIGLFKEDLEQYNMILDNYKELSSDDGTTAYELAKMSIIQADRWNEIAFNASKYAKQAGMAKVDVYQWAYHKYRILMVVHEFCRVVYRQCEEESRTRWNEN